MTGVRTVAFPEMTEEQRRIYRAREALHRDGGSPAGALELLAALVEDQTWERATDANGRSFAGRFSEFVKTRAFGLDYDTDQLQKLLLLQHPHESASPKVRERMEHMRREVRGLLDGGVAAAPRNGEVGRGRTSSRDTLPEASPGESDKRDRVIARLKRDDPATAERAISGEISANAAAREKGWRRPRIVVSSPERVAEALRRTMPPEDLARLATILNGGTQ